MTESRSLGAAELLRSVGLMADGPVHWGNPVRVGGPGVYVVELAAPVKTAPIDHQLVGHWIERVPGLTLDATRPTARELAVRLGEFWLPDETVVYIGMTNLSIGGRVGAFAKAVTPAAKKALRDASVVLPFANLQTATDERKQHGIRGSLVVDEAGGPVTKAERVAAAAAAARGNGTGKRIQRSGPARPRGTTPRAATGSRAAAAALKAAGRPAGPAVQLSPEGLLALQAELANLTTVQRPAIVARIAAARELGDLKENSDYHEARREQSFAEGRVLQLEDQLRNAVVVQGGGGPVVDVGSTVVVERMDAAGALETTTFKIVGAAEASPRTDKISNVSPIGAALVGRTTGDAVEVVIPSGRIGFRILEVR